MTTPVAIRRAPADFHLPKSHHHNHNHRNGHVKINTVNHHQTEATTTPNGNNLFGTTPGGTNRIVYSREQLLLLASSPLSQTITPVPQEISRSPELTSNAFPQQQQRRNSTRTSTNGSSTVRNPSPPWTTVTKPGNGRKNDIKPLNMNNVQYGRSPIRSSSANFNVGSIGSAGITSSTITRSPPNSASKPRSPGNAFNFGKIGGGQQQTNTTPSSFKERLEAAEAAVAKQQTNNKDDDDEDEDSSLVNNNNLKRGRLGSNSSTSTTSNGNNNHHENDEQFAMEM
jgi:Eukaryotic translation initiation factor 4E binding protein (EIF4EBP)